MGSRRARAFSRYLFSGSLALAARGRVGVPLGRKKIISNLDLPPPRIPVANEGLGWDSLLKMVHNPGGDCYWVGGRPNF